MKSLISLALALSLVPMQNSFCKDTDGHILTKLWEEYREADRRDLPETAAGVLDKIKKEALRGHYTWDYYDAAHSYVLVRSRADWKLRDSLERAFEAEIEAFGEPVAVYYMKRGQKDLLKYVKDNEKKLRSGSNPEFWKRDAGISQYKFAPALLPMLQNDLQYCLWSLSAKDELPREHKSYPLAALAEFPLPGSPERVKALEDYALKYKDKAAGLLAEEDLLQYKFSLLQGKGSSEDFKALRAECKALTGRASEYKGEEKALADCCLIAEALAKRMDSRNIEMEIKGGVLRLFLQNIESGKIIVRRGEEKIWESAFGNPERSYYATDTLTIPLPLLPDGRYSVQCLSGKDESSLEWEKFTLAAASRRNAGGLGVWAADYLSGEPVKQASLQLLKDGKVFRTQEIFDIQGFTTIPKEMDYFLEHPGSSEYLLRLKLGDRLSENIFNDYYYEPDLSDNPAREHCLIICDRSAFKPGETVHFKAVIYTGKYSLKAASGAMVRVLLQDSEGKTINSKDFTAGGSGSIAGEFELKRRPRNGNYYICVQKDSRNIGRKAVLVDDFVLPSFDLSFDRLPEMNSPVDSVSVKGSLRAYSGHLLAGADISYRVEHWGEEWASGKIFPDGERFEIKFPTDRSREYPWGDSYTLSVKVTDASGETMEFQKWINVGGMRRKAPQTDHFFEDVSKDGSLAVRIVAGTMPVWMLAELYGTGNRLLGSKIIHFVPREGKYAEKLVEIPYLEEYPDALLLNLLYFENGRSYSFSLSKARPDTRWDLPLSFERFMDNTVPGGRYNFAVRTGAGAEIALSIFDKSTERFMTNSWRAITPSEMPAPHIYFTSYPGGNDGVRRYFATRAGGMKQYALAADSSAPQARNTSAVPEEAQQAEEIADESIAIREDFATTIAWEPYLKADENGLAEFSFSNSDKLSTFYVQVFAHDAAMRSAALRREMLVSIPVKINLVEPLFLYEGDSWTVRTALSSNISSDAAGRLNLTAFAGADYRTAPVICSYSKRITVPGGGSSKTDLPFQAPAGTDTVGVKISFVPDEVLNASDAVFVKIPIKKPEQNLTEGHSAVLLAGADKAALEERLRGEFVNVDGNSARLREISVMDMISEALPEVIKVRRENAIDLSSALYADLLCKRLGLNPEFDRAGAEEKLRSLQNADGGFAWFRGMGSSPIITAVVLQRLHGSGIIDEDAAVKFLDKEFFKNKSLFYNSLSLGQYLYTRSLFPGIRLQQSPSKSIRKAVRAYLVPKKERGLQGQVFAKALRLLTLDNLLENEGGRELARKMGISACASKRLSRSIEADAASLAEYARKHKSGGIYYPNAIMPARGLLESELYAHSLICTLMQKHSHGDIADGIRLWTMLQKETQHWEAEPGYIEALAAVTEADEKIKNTKVLALSADFSKPFAQIQPASNGMDIRLEETGSARIGDRVRISWTVSSEENRSFVKLTLPHTAGLIPVNQISGFDRGAYRSVLADRTELWFEVFPEEQTVISEEYYAVRSGSFQSPATSVECLYAPHYRANTAAPERQEISL